VETPLNPGDLFCLYSDGVTEAASPDGELFGIERLLAVIRDHHTETPKKIIFSIREAIKTHTGQSALTDDFTCVLVHVTDLPEEWKTLEHEFPNTLSHLADMREFVARAALDCGLSRTAIDELQIAAHEATTNAIVHGQRDRPNELLRFRAERLAEGIRLTLIYRGEPFEPGEVASLNLDDPREGGLGLYIIQGSLDEVQYRHVDGDNWVVMTKTG
jgi:sigma-B regulation protein RsbU (phosphoserine phosphatase)